MKIFILVFLMLLPFLYIENKNKKLKKENEQLKAQIVVDKKPTIEIVEVKRDK